MNIPNHECDECGREAGYRETMNCLCEKCFQKALDEARLEGVEIGEQGKEQATHEATSKLQ